MMIDLKQYTEKELIALQASIQNEISERKKERYKKLTEDLQVIIETLANEFPYEIACYLDDYEADELNWKELEKILI